MSFYRLKWLAILAPVGFIGVLEYARYALAPVAGQWQGHLLLDAVVLLGAVFFYGAVFSVVDTFQRELRQRNEELAALHEAGLDIVSDLSLDTMLQKVIDRARDLLGTRFGALAVYNSKDTIERFITSGVEQEVVERIGTLPSGQGLLGVVLREGHRMRIDNLGKDPRSCGFPPNHPEMSSLLAVPVVCRGPCRGNIYLSEKHDGSKFTDEDEKTLVRFATQAAIAVDNAHLYAQVEGLAVMEERLRLAREMHDGQAQVLAFVNTKAQAVRELQRAGRREEADQHLEQLAAAAREVYADVREGIMGLRAAVNSENGLTDALKLHVEHWQDQCGIAVTLQAGELPRFPADVELQLLRVLQEALANVRKHSKANRVEVTLAAQESTITAQVKDNGKGFDPSTFEQGGKPRFGLAIMRERAESIGARLEIHSRLGAGSCVKIELPIEDHMTTYPPPSEEPEPADLPGTNPAKLQREQ